MQFGIGNSSTNLANGVLHGAGVCENLQKLIITKKNEEWDYWKRERREKGRNEKENESKKKRGMRKETYTTRGKTHKRSKRRREVILPCDYYKQNMEY